jgi:hypothetical protein
MKTRLAALIAAMHDTEQSGESVRVAGLLLYFIRINFQPTLSRLNIQLINRRLREY